MLNRKIQRIKPKLIFSLKVRGFSLEERCCALATSILKKYLEEERLSSVVVVSKHHSFIKVDNLIIDPTIRQFFLSESGKTLKTIPQIFVGTKKQLEQLFQKHKSQRFLPISVNELYGFSST